MMKILVVRYRFIGDTILTIPFLRNLRYKYPDAQIDMLVAPNSGEAIENCPYVNNFIYYDTTRKHKYEIGSGEKKSFLYYVFELKKEKYDKAYILKRSFSSALLCYLAGIKERIGFDTEHRGFLLTKKVKYNTKKHESQCFLDVLNADGIEIKNTYLENWIKQDSVEKIRHVFLKNGVNEKESYAVINMTASNDNKTWGIKNFVNIVEYLSNEKEMKVIFVGAPSDREIYEKLRFVKPLKVVPANLCGKIGIKDSLAVLKGAEFVIGNDSGTLHMASSVGTRVIGLYGPMPFEKWRALGKNNILLKSDLGCMPCSLKGACRHDKACMKAITVDRVKQAIDKMLSE